MHQPMRKSEEEHQVNEWVNQQSVTWAAFTLKCPRFRSRDRWERLIYDTLNIMEKNYVKASVKEQRKTSGEQILKRIVFLGGDNQNYIALHAHGLIELIDDDIERLNLKLESAWHRAVESNGRFLSEHSRENLGNEAKVWVQKFDDCDAYLHYVNRYEGSSLGFGIEKIVWSATSLKPSAACNT